MSKKKMKTDEELLQDALVPIEEQPYEIPSHWKWVRLGYMVNHISENIEPLENEPYVGLEHLLKGGGISNCGSTNEVKSSKSKFQKGDILYGKLRPYLNKHAIVNFSGVCSTDIMVIRAKDNCIAGYVKYYINTGYVINFANSNSSGINLPRISPKKMLELPIPLPPLDEQKSIADKIERMLDKINQSKRLIEERFLDSIEIRQAILSKAFEGQLTKKWRNNKKISNVTSLNTSDNKQSNIPSKKIPMNWKWVLSKELFSFVTSGSRGWAQYYSDEGSLFIRVGNLKKNTIQLDLSSTQYVSPPSGAEGTRTKVQYNDILVSITGEVGMIGLIPMNFSEAYINQHVALVRPNTGVYPEYIAWYLASREGGYAQLLDMQRGVTKAGLRLEDIRNMWIPLPTFDEQNEVVRRINSIFAILDKYDEQKKHTNKLLDILPQSIMSKAFKGELL